MLTDSEKASIRTQIRWNQYQLSEAEVAARCGYPLAEFQALYESWPELPGLIEIARLEGLSSLRRTIWDKGLDDKNWDVLRLLAAEYLSFQALSASADGPFKMTLSDDQLAAFRSILDPRLKKGKKDSS